MMDEGALVGLTPLADQQAQQRTLHYFEQLKASSDGWKLCASQLTSNSVTDNNEAVKFFCFQVVEHYLRSGYASCSADDHQAMKTLLLRYLEIQATQTTKDKSFVRNKAAQIYALALVVDYPRRWNSFFQELLLALKLGQSAVDMYLRILMAVDSEVVDREVVHTAQEAERNTLIKDTMRVQCVPQMVASWYDIATRYKTENPELVCQCIEVIGAYVSWIDILHIANDKFVNMLLSYFSEESLRESACDCVHEIMQKGMDPLAKTKLIESFDQALQRAGVFNIKGEDDSDFTAKLAKLVNGIVLQLIAAWQKTVKSGDADSAKTILTLLDAKIPLAFRFLAHEDDDVSGAVTQATREYVNLVLKPQSVLNDNLKTRVKELLLIVIKKMKFDDDYNFEHECDDELVFQEYRRELKILFNNLGALDAALVSATVNEVLATTFAHEKADFADVEVAVTLLYMMAEAIPTSQQFKADGSATELQLMMRMLMDSRISCHPHRAVVLQFFETVVRYDKFFNIETRYLPDVLMAFLDERGLRNSNQHVSSRAAYLFSRFVKNIQKNHLQNFLEDILKRIQDMLVLGSPDNGVHQYITYDDQLFVYETAGILIVQSQFPPEKKQELMRAMLVPLVTRFGELLRDMIAEPNEKRQQAFAKLLGHAMAFASRTSKGFSNSVTMKQCGCVAAYTDCLRVFLSALSCPVQRATLHAGVRGFLHRLVVCLEDEVLPFIPSAMDQLLQNADARELHDFIPLLNQTVSKFKKQLVPFLTSAFMPLVSAIFNVLLAPADERDQNAATERRLLQRSYFTFLSTLVNYQVTDVLANQEAAHLHEVLITVIQGAVEIPDPQSQKVCFNILKRLVELWGPKTGGLPGFEDFIYKNIVPACFQAPLKPSFDLTDAQTILALNECAECLKTVLEKRGDEFLLFLENDYFPKQDVSAGLSQEFCMALKQDNKRFRHYFKQFYIRAKS